MTRILLNLLLLLLFQQHLLGNPGKNSTAEARVQLPSFQSIAEKNGEKVIFWENFSSLGMKFPQFYLQRTNKFGEQVWGNDVELTSNLNSIQSSHKMISDGSGGVIITWEERLENQEESNIYIQRIDSAGRRPWGEEPVIVSTASGSQVTPYIVTDGNGGAIVAWSDSRNDATLANWDVYAQRINKDGIQEWETDGIVISADARDEHLAKLLPSANGGFIVVWNMVIPSLIGSGEGYDFYSRKINSKGEWSPTLIGSKFLSLPVSTVNYNLGNDILTDGQGGFFLSLVSQKNDQKSNLVVQHVLENGEAAFNGEFGMSVDSEASEIQNITLQTDSLGNSIVTWSGKQDTALVTYMARFVSPATGDPDSASRSLDQEILASVTAEPDSLPELQPWIDPFNADTAVTASASEVISSTELADPPDSAYNNPQEHQKPYPSPQKVAFSVEPEGETLTDAASKRGEPMPQSAEISPQLSSSFQADAAKYEFSTRLKPDKIHNKENLAEPDPFLESKKWVSQYSYKLPALKPALNLLHPLPD